MTDIIDAAMPIAGVLAIFSIGAFAIEFVSKKFVAPVTGPIPVPVTPPSPQPGTDNPPSPPPPTSGAGDEFVDITDEWLFGPLLTA